MKFEEWVCGIASGISGQYSSVEAELQGCLPADLEVELAAVDLRNDTGKRVLSRSFLLLTANSLIRGSIQTPNLPQAEPDRLQVALAFHPLNQIVAAQQLTTFTDGTLAWSRDVTLTVSFAYAPNVEIPLRGANVEPDTLKDYRAIANAVLKKIV